MKQFNLKMNDGSDAQLSIEPLNPLKFTEGEWDGRTKNFEEITKGMSDEEYAEFNKEQIINNGLSEGRILLNEEHLATLDNPYMLNIIEAKNKHYKYGGEVSIATFTENELPDDITLINLAETEAKQTANQFISEIVENNVDIKELLKKLQ